MSRGRGAITLLVAAACGHASPPPEPIAPPPLTIPTIPPPAPPAPPKPAHACPAPAAVSGRYLSVRASYSVGRFVQVESLCDRLSVWTQGGGLRLLDPKTGVMTARLPFDERVVNDALLPTGAIELWNAKEITVIDRLDLEPRWSALRSRRGRVFIAGRWVIEEAGEACQPTCAVIARDAATGALGWQRPCPCDALWEQKQRPPELYESMTEIDGKIVATQLPHGLEAWDAKDGHTLWERTRPQAPVRGRVVGKFIALDPSLGFDRSAPNETTLLDANGAEVRRLTSAQERLEAMAADGDTVFLSSSNVPEHGGIATVVVEGLDVRTGTRVTSTKVKFTVRRYASDLPQMWVTADRVYYHEIDNGLLTTIDRASGQVLSSIGVAAKGVRKTPTGFVTFTEDGIVDVLEPSDVELPATSRVKVEGQVTLRGRPMSNVELVVGNVVTRTRSDGHYSATLEARGTIWVKAKQPTSAESNAYWVGADRALVVDGRSESYVIDLHARRDYLE